MEERAGGSGFGADAYMTKPFHKDELVARIHAIVRRSKGHAQSVIQTADLVVNLDTKTVEVDGARVHLTGNEYQMLELLSLRKATTLTKEMFLNHLYGGMHTPEPRTAPRWRPAALPPPRWATAARSSRPRSRSATVTSTRRGNTGPSAASARACAPPACRAARAS